MCDYGFSCHADHQAAKVWKMLSSHIHFVKLKALLLSNSEIIHRVLHHEYEPIKNNEIKSRWHQQMETISALMTLCEGNSPLTRKGQWRRVWCFLWTNDWVNARDAGDLRRNCSHYDVTLSNGVFDLLTPREHRVFHGFSCIIGLMWFYYQFTEHNDCYSAICKHKENAGLLVQIFMHEIITVGHQSGCIDDGHSWYDM